MKYVRIALALLALAVCAIQFFRPPRNLSHGPPERGIEGLYPVPDRVMQIFRRSCYDCHSDSTVYPWYAEIQPLAWWLNSHIEQGKRQMDFDMFAGYRPFRQYGKFRDIIEQIQKDEMPLPSYLIIHRYARLTPDEKEEVLRWSRAMMDTMRARYPADSLQRRRPEGRAGK